MNKNWIASVTVNIQSPADKVWDALVNPRLIKQYLFGTEVVTDWMPGSPIIYKGIWNGKPYEDKGKIIKIVPGKLLESTFWSSLEGLPDVPENYKKVTYELTAGKDGTRLTLTQDNNATEEDKNHSEQNWKMVMDGLKALLENNR